MFFLLFIALTIAEVYLLIQLFGALGFLYTLGIILLTGALGIRLMKSQGHSIMGRIQGELAQGKMPATALIEGLLVLFAAVFLITPGILTDTMGFCLLLPHLRRVVARQVAHHYKDRFVVRKGSLFGVGGGATQRSATRSDGVIDVEWEEESNR